ncbi:hypothetical protein GCM10017744_007820 [Streptomyces antimycoticus]
MSTWPGSGSAWAQDSRKRTALAPVRFRMAAADVLASAVVANGSPPFSSSLVSPDTLKPRSTISRPCPSANRVPSTVIWSAARPSNQGASAAAAGVPGAATAASNAAAAPSNRVRPGRGRPIRIPRVS